MILLLAATPAYAQSRFEIGAAVTWTGGFDAGGVDALETRNSSTDKTPFTLFETSSRVTDAPGVAARVGFFITPRLAVEAVVEYGRPMLETTISNDFEDATGTEASGRISSYVLGGSVLYHFGAARLVPFVSAGAARLRQLDDAEISLVTATELHAGGGVKYRLSRHFGLRADAGVSSRDKSLAFEGKRRTVPVFAAGLAYRF